MYSLTERVVKHNFKSLRCVSRESSFCLNSGSLNSPLLSHSVNIHPRQIVCRFILWYVVVNLTQHRFVVCCWFRVHFRKFIVVIGNGISSTHGFPVMCRTTIYCFHTQIYVKICSTHFVFFHPNLFVEIVG